MSANAINAGPRAKLDFDWRLLRYVKPYRLQVGIAAVLFIISSGLFLFFPLVSGQLVNSVAGVPGTLSPANIIVILIGLFVLRAIADIFSQYLITAAGEAVTLKMRTDVYQHIQSLGLSFFATRRTGELISRLASDISVVRVTIVNNLASLLSNVLTLVGAIVLIVVTNWRLTLVVLVVFPIATLIARFYSRSLRPLSTQVQDHLAETNAIAEEAIGGVRVVKSFGREAFEVKRYETAAGHFYLTSLKLARLRATFGPLIGLMFFFALVGILWFGSQEVMAGRLQAGDLVSFLLYGGVVATGVSTLVSVFTQYQEAVGATRRIFEILDTQSNVVDAPNARNIGAAQGGITFDNVSFAYENKIDVVRDISLQIAPGEILALVGPSGAGKSTLFNLIPRFYDPSAGSVRLDGVDLRDITVESLRANIAIVPQDTLLFSGSVRENILYGRLDASEAEIIAAARAANAHQFVTELPQGYDTLVGERGVKLSGGQRQRIAIARAVLKDPRILLLDEATSSLDSESEGLVQEALGRLMQGRTTIIIAHRLSTVQVADRIAVLDKGNLVELGTHDELIARGGLYNRLYTLQFQMPDETPQDGATDEVVGESTTRKRRRGFSPLSLLSGS
ncbi:MAG: ABC transporter ATP-binding protein/permease [Chloroflexi bacterium]|nr:ABC transporter ATP-binding protein/permease [Chloroflexota bacterium]MCL5275918.1 ABC transporter ATP-binding protein/permease [Chloroflexota bacterium]